ALRPTRDGRAQSGAFQALGATRNTDAIPLLRAYAAYGGSPIHARPAAVRALATLAKNLERPQRAPIVEALTDLLRDPWQSVAFAAARGLADLGEPAAISA